MEKGGHTMTRRGTAGALGGVIPVATSNTAWVVAVAEEEKEEREQEEDRGGGGGCNIANI